VLGSALALAARAGAATPAELETGKRVYEQNCAQCHGETGDGQGPGTPHLLPRPRDFTSGKFKLRTTPSGMLPTDDDLTWAAQHRSAFMWPWETEQHSVATGILDDETYDWLAVVRGTLVSGGAPVVVDEDTLIEANEIARSTTGIDVDATGSAGLAGLIELRRHGRVDSDETVAVIFTGVRRGSATDADSPQPPVGGPR